MPLVFAAGPTQSRWQSGYDPTQHYSFRSTGDSTAEVSLFDGEGYPERDKVWATPSSSLQFETRPSDAAELYADLEQLDICTKHATHGLK